MLLNAEKLSEIMQEARACFLYEDAPDYLAILEQGMQRLRSGDAALNLQSEYSALMRAAHSIKGGAGLSELHSLSKLAHKLEDLLEALHSQLVPEPEVACELVCLGVEAIGDLVAAAISGKDTEIDRIAILPLFAALDSFLEDLPKQIPHQGISPLAPLHSQEASLPVSSVPPAILKAALEIDLEDCLQRVEQLLPQQGQSLSIANLSSLHQNITNLIEECTLLGQTLNLTWLTDIVHNLQQELSHGNPPLEKLAKNAIASIRQLREQFLNPPSSSPSPSLATVGAGLEDNLEPKQITFQQNPPSSSPSPSLATVGAGLEDNLEPKQITFQQNPPSSSPSPSLATVGAGLEDNLEPKQIIFQQNPPSSSPSPSPYPPSSSPSTSPAPSSPHSLNLNLRIPVSRLDRMSNTVGELLINHSRLFLYQKQLHQASLMLKKHTHQMNPIREQVQDFYDRTSTPLLFATTELPSPDTEFDPLELDRYTEFHSTLQDFQELMVRVEESRNDIEVVARDLNEGIEQLRQQLDHLRVDLTQSRLVPFKFLADRFVAPLQTLNHRYNKSVSLDVVGKDILIDQVILEQLQTPLTHLLRNAFDHGIETPSERSLLDKPPQAKITLSADVKGNKVSIAISDDGRGIDCKKVYQKAVQVGLCSLDAAALSREEIIEFLFAPGFSTAETVTDISGRGVGLDVVREQVSRLRGEVKVITALAQGTTFTLTLPLTLSILPLLLCRCQQRILAIPSISVLEIIALSEYTLGTGEAEPHHPRSQAEPGNEFATMISWRDRQIPVFPLMQLLPYSQTDIFSPSVALNPPLGIVLDVEGEPIVVAVDSLVGERELVLKPFDATIPVPAYIAGCTVLGTGEVVPILSPSNFGELIARASQATRPSFPGGEPMGTRISGIPRQEAGNEAQVHKAWTQASTILIVDDSIAVRRLLNRVLSEAGYQVVECRDGKEALDQLNQSRERFDLVISDIEMPRLDGFGLLKEISIHPRWHSLQIIMLTSRSNDRHREKAMSLGATAYLTKPFRPGELLGAIANIVGSDRAGSTLPNRL